MSILESNFYASAFVSRNLKRGRSASNLPVISPTYTVRNARATYPKLSSKLDEPSDSLSHSENRHGGKGDVKVSNLCFVGRTSFASDPIPIPPGGRKDLIEYFRDPLHRNHLLMGHGVPDGTDATSALPSVERIGNDACRDENDDNDDNDGDLWERWSIEAARAGMALPNPSEDDLLLVKSSAIPFALGMVIFAESIVGAKLLVEGDARQGHDHDHVNDHDHEHEGGTRYPEYQFTLIKDSVRAEGPSVLVWIYNKLTGAGKGRKKAQSTHSFSTLRIDASTGLPGMMTFLSDSCIEINVHFSSVLLRLLPMSREECNELGSASIQHAFEDRGAASLENFVMGYKTWLRYVSNAR